MALATLAALKEYLELTGTAHDARLTALLTRSDEFVKKFTKRVLEVPGSDVTEFYDGNFTDAIFLREFPIVSVTSVHDDTARVFGADTLIAAADYVVVKDPGYIRYLYGLRFVKGAQNVQVKYKGGYSTIPKDIEMASIYAAAFWFEERKNIELGSRNIRDGGTTGLLHDIPMSVKEMLAPYVRKEVG